MSLRVLLADESDTIKKVFQLALQDMNVEIKTVQSGLDVANVAQNFLPQIIFADVLLQKKNGYDTCLEIKQNKKLASIPIILMWSSFMELDQEQFAKSKAEDQLEKPFDADLLRNMVKKYVPKAGENPLSQFLKFPKNLVAPAKPKDTPTPVAPVSEKSSREESSEFNLNSILSDLTSTSAEAPPSFSDEAIEMPSLDSPLPSEFDQFKIDTNIDNLEKFETLNLSEKIPTAPIEKTSVSMMDEIEISEEVDDVQPTQLSGLFKNKLNSEKSRLDIPAPMDDDSSFEPSVVMTPEQATRTMISKGLDTQEIEAIVRAHTEEFIKNQLQHNLLEIVERVVREELNKVLDEEVRLKQDMQDDSP